MFVMSKKNFRIRRADGSSFLIRKDYIGELPEDVSAHWLVQGAIADGSIATPKGKEDAAVDAAAKKAKGKAKASDLRPDAPKEEDLTGTEE